jgi:hypothetical protein
MPNILAGGCACGAVRYECDSEPMFTWICHCRDCQRSTGGGGAVNVVLPKPSERFVKGEPKYFISIGTSGNKTHHGFCPECGSPLAAKADLIATIQGLSAASFDDPRALKLVADIWTANAQPWDSLSPALAKFAATPNEEELRDLITLAHNL